MLPVVPGVADPLLVSACLTNPSGPPTQEPTTITLSTYRIVFTAVNDHVRIDATVLDQDSRVIADATVNWRSADSGVARVSDRGVVTAAGSGTTQIIVTSGYATATATVSVEQTADSIEITPSSITDDACWPDRPVHGGGPRRERPDHPGRVGGVVEQQPGDRLR